jgi:geranylgeranyl diphosphate synthase type II
VTAPVLEDYLTACQQACDGEVRRLFAPTDQAPGTLFDLVLDYPRRGGKGLRPTLGIAMCLGLGGSLEAVLPTAATLELYHNAFLIHDDIEDESLLRRGSPALHVEHGVPVAVNVGDAMLSLSLQPLLDNVERIGLGPALRILRAVAQMTRRTVEGQAVELEWVRTNAWRLADEDYLAMVELKTSWYSFITPLQVGAIAAGAGAGELAALEPIGRYLGAAFQITDDLLNLRADPEDYGKEIGGDLWEGKRTLMLLHALRTAGQADRGRALAVLARRRPAGLAEPDLRALLDGLVATGDLTPSGRSALRMRVPSLSAQAPKCLDDIQWLYEMLLRTNSLQHARVIARREADAAATALGNLAWMPPSRHRDVLSALVDYVHERTR